MHRMRFTWQKSNNYILLKLGITVIKIITLIHHCFENEHYFPNTHNPPFFPWDNLGKHSVAVDAAVAENFLLPFL